MSSPSTLLDGSFKYFPTDNQQTLVWYEGFLSCSLQNSVNVLLFKGLVSVVYIYSIASKLQYIAVNGKTINK